MKVLSLTLSALIALSAPAWAEFAKIDDEAAFLQVVEDKTLTRPFVKLRVLPTGQIAGTGAAWKVSGNWQWKDGYFCRTLFWGGEDYGYNCQEVRFDGQSLRFTSDQGKGDSADFRLR